MYKSVHPVYRKCTHSVRTCTPSVQDVYTQLYRKCTPRMQEVCTQCTGSVQDMYTQCTALSAYTCWVYSALSATSVTWREEMHRFSGTIEVCQCNYINQLCIAVSGLYCFNSLLAQTSHLPSWLLSAIITLCSNPTIV